MSHNSFGHLYRVTTWGESHGPAIGCVIDGCPAGISLDVKRDIQPFLDKRRPGRSRFVTQRQEADQAEILSGVFEGQTTGTPIHIIIHNTDQRSKDYGDIAHSFRPGHADYSYHEKYGIRDYRGGGRSSARETAMRVAAGAVALRVLRHYHGDSFVVSGGMIQMGAQALLNPGDCDWQSADDNDFFCPDPETIPLWEKQLSSIRKQGLSVGAIIQIQAEAVPAGWGAPLYGKLDADLAAAMMSINAVKAVEIGAGMSCAAWTGIENSDEMLIDDNGEPVFTSNHAGGILGGISTGQPIIVRFVVKPTSSILVPRRSVDIHGKACEVITKGRHDPCVGIRAVPVGQAMMLCVLLDHFLRHRGQMGEK